jgi:hypothetical protein
MEKTDRRAFRAHSVVLVRANQMNMPTPLPICPVCQGDGRHPLDSSFVCPRCAGAGRVDVPTKQWLIGLGFSGEEASELMEIQIERKGLKGV